MTRIFPVVAFLLALVLGGLPAQAQVASWWLGGNGDGAENTAEQVNWWLGTRDENQVQQVQADANQGLGWWLGGGAETTTSQGANTEEGSASDPPNYDEWERVKRRVEAGLNDSGTPSYILEKFRSELVEWREKFLSAQSINQTRIETLRTQISALGPAPAEGESEADEIASRRQELNAQLSELQAPGIAAQEAYLGADGLIGEIDSTLRERQTNQLLELSPSPLSPLNWPTALTTLAKIGGDIWSEVAQSWNSPTTRQRAQENLPVILLAFLAGFMLMFKGRRWSDILATRLLSGTGRRAKRVVLSLLVSLGQVILPFFGIILIVIAARYTGFDGRRGVAFLDALPTVAFVILAARWLGHQIFARSDETALLAGLAPERRAEGRLYAQVLGLLFGLSGLLGAMVPYEEPTLTARVVLAFPILLLGGLILFRIGQLLVTAAKAAVEAEHTTRAQILKLIGRGAILLGIAGPLLAAVGYYTLARFLIFPAVLSLTLLALLSILQRLTSDLYALISRRPDEEDQEALIPVLVGFVLVLMSLPIFALIWGARTADLTELWAKVREGFQFGETRIAPGDFLTFAVIFTAGYVATRLLQGTLRGSILPKTRIDAGGQTAIVSGVGYLGIFLAAVIAITGAGIDLSSLAIVAGALSVGIGFGLQNIVSNFISGIILLIERPISEGDWIEVNGQGGYVRNIAVRSTRIETFDRTDVIVPNSDLISGIVTNYTRGNLTGRIIIPIGVAYGSDTRKVETILREVAEAHPLVSLNPKPAVLFRGFGADSLDFEIRAILRDVNFSLSTVSDMNHEIAERFIEEDIEIPFAQRDIWLRNPEALRGEEKPVEKPKRKRSKPVPPSDPVDPALTDIVEDPGDIVGDPGGDK